MFTGAERLVESYGLGSVVPNTVLLGDSEQAELRAGYCGMIAHFHDAQRNVVIVTTRTAVSAGAGASTSACSTTAG